MLEKIQSLLQEVEGLKAQSAEEIEQLRIKYLSKKGEITALMADFRNVPAEQKKEIGIKINELKNKAMEKINSLRDNFAVQETEVNHLDITRTPYPIPLGTRHPLTLVKNEIIDIFSRLGFSLAEGPEVEDDWHVFSSMNFAEDHPARDMQDTFFVEAHPDIILRTHTSSVQARVMEKQQPPIRVLCPGRVYRNEAISARAHCFFHQVEGLYVDEQVSFTDLKQVLLLFAKEMFGEDTQIRLRPSYFPFTEPSAEMDVSCTLCKGKGCSMCKGSGWLEILGCGMVHPNVLEANGIEASYVNPLYLNSFDKDDVAKLLGYENVLVYDSYGVENGFASKLGSVLMKAGYKGNFIAKAIGNDFVSHMSIKEQKSLYGLNPEEMLEFIKATY